MLLDPLFCHLQHPTFVHQDTVKKSEKEKDSIFFRLRHLAFHC